jgi:hypothetical protein
MLFRISVVAETPGNLKIPRIHRNLSWISVYMRMRFREPLPSKLCQSLGNSLIYPSVFVAAETCFNKPLPRNGRLSWLHHSAFQAPCHNMSKFVSTSRCLGMVVFPDSAIPGFRRHATICPNFPTGKCLFKNRIYWLCNSGICVYVTKWWPRTFASVVDGV